MQDGQPLAIDTLMNERVSDFHQAIILGEIPQKCVVIAGRVVNFCSRNAQLEQAGNQLSRCRCPADTTTHAPVINDIANQVNFLRQATLQQFEQAFCLAKPTAQVNVRQKQSSRVGQGPCLLRLLSTRYRCLFNAFQGDSLLARGKVSVQCSRLIRNVAPWLTSN